jgi:DNA ligase-1
MWQIEVNDNVITTRFGREGGKIQETRDTIETGKNTGKANETTASEQAALEAKSLWQKKVSRGYTEDGKEPDLGGIEPMLAHRFDQHGHKIQYPAFVQPKLDGHRCIAVIDQAGKATLWTRQRKPITGVPHIVEAVERWARGHRPMSGILDGELYNHDYRDNFEDLTGFIRSPTPKLGYGVVEYHIYDIAESGSFSHRFSVLNTFPLYSPLQKVETVEVTDEDSLMLAYESFVAQGYEGAIVRNMDSEYANHRSFDLQKIKEFVDEEFVIVGVEGGRGKMAGHGIFVCQTANGLVFRAKMQGTLSELTQYYRNSRAYIGKKLTVQFQGYTQTGIPRFPVALRIRED